MNKEEVPAIPVRKGRCQIGENRGAGKERRNQSFSKRALQGNLEVIEKKCPFCHHHKALKTIMGAPKCSKCKRTHK